MKPTTVHALETAIRQCDDGIALLAGHNYEGGIRSFSNSLRIARDFINDTARNGDDGNGNTCLAMMIPRRILLEQCLAGSSAIEQPLKQMFQTSKQEDDQSFFFYQAIPFLPRRSRREELFNSIHLLCNEDLQSIAIVLSAVSVFNMGLAHHLSANSADSGNNDAKVKLAKAAKLYDLAFSLQTSEELANCVQFTMALLNNLGLVHKQLSNQEASQMCFEQLLSATMFVVTTCRVTSSLNGFDDGTIITSQEECSRQSHSLEGFLSNTSSVCFKRRTAPAA